ncbi:hypothetical protein MUU74_13210 [Chryseobacterium daecheongense]|uniref:hypothetical protein n=1 Tax=Chryseobacterium daecheongense TaxID=192389 RepID=UPI001FD64E22|nr:hypothetical protein [Chryseobacterium daecheongense]UOU97448.1 hypothetical protein MUU74_13210 [Chryseobacterium daecheongense]
MKRVFLISLLTVSLYLSAQTASQLKFDTNVPDAENSWVVMPKKDGETKYNVGIIYFDDTAGYSYRMQGSLSEENGKLKYTEDERNKISSSIIRVGNMEFKTAKLTPEQLKQFSLPAQPDWLKQYTSSDSENEKILKRASNMNGANFPQLALPRLQKLYQNNFITEKLYFELSFSYNALKDYVNAEKICLEAFKNKISDDLINKEYIYALLNQNKLADADSFLTQKLNSFKNKDYRAESMLNLGAYAAHYKNLDLAKKWLDVLKKENDERYKKNVQNLENIINKTQN